MIRLLGVTGTAFLLACAAVGVPATSDPYKELGQVEYLLHNHRPFPAERILNEAIGRFEAAGDKKGLAIAYDEYGFFLRHPNISEHADVYTNRGFLDRTVTYDNRFQKSIEYFLKAKAIGIEIDKPDFLCHVCYNMGVSYLLLKQDAQACEAYDDSFKYYQKNITRNPRAKSQVPKGFKNFEEYILDCKKRAGCPS